MTKTYLNTKTGLKEYVSNAMVIEQCDKHPEIYKPVDDTPKFIKLSKKDTKGKEKEK